MCKTKGEAIDWNARVELIKNVVAIIAIILGGIWTYFLFVNDRMSKPKMKLDLQLQCYNYTQGKRLVYVRATMNNVGNSVLESDSANIRLRQVIPLSAERQASVDQNYDIVYAGQNDANWQPIAQRFWKEKETPEWYKRNIPPIIVEPGEDGELQAEFIIDQKVKAVEVYLWLANPENETFGWTKSHLYIFNDDSPIAKNKLPGGLVNCVQS